MGYTGVNRRVREAMVSGIFYPDDAATLMAAVDAALERVSVPFGGVTKTRPSAILAPHAAFEYAGEVQAAAWYAASVSPVDRVIIIAPLRRLGEAGAYLSETHVFQTPLGDVEVDTDACADLESCGTLFSCSDIPHFESHAIEVQLPFMRRIFPDASLVPVLVGGDAKVAASLARAIDIVFGDDMDRTLIVASSNLASSIVAADACRRSYDLLRIMASKDWRDLADRRDFAGSTAIAATMAVESMRDSRFSLLRRGDSQRAGASGMERIVNYAAASWHAGGAS